MSSPAAQLLAATPAQLGPAGEHERIRAGYRLARAVTARHAKSFYFASALLFGHRRKAAFALYAFCRHLDDLVDAPKTVDPKPALARARAGLAGLYDGAPVDELELPASPEELMALRDTVRRYDVPLHALVDLLAGMEMDLTLHRYRTWDELELYCYRVAGTVGLMMAPVLGCRDSNALPYAADLGRAMQLTNILRDVREDLGRGRVYLPAEELAAFQLTVADLEAGTVDDRFRAFMRWQIHRARAYFQRGEAGIGALSGFGSQATVRTMSRVYAGILDAIEAADYDVFSARAHVPFARKLSLAASAVLRPGPSVLVPPSVSSLPAGRLP